MLKHCLSSALVLAQLAFAGPLNLELRNDISSCASVKTVTTTVTSEVTVTVQAPTEAADSTGNADAPSPCHPSGSGEDASSTTDLTISPTTAAGDGSNDSSPSSQEVVEPAVSPTTAALPSETQDVLETPPAGRNFSNMLYFGAW